MKPLSRIRHEQFASKVYIENKDASKAYSEVYGTPKSSPSTWSAASRLLRHVDVQASIEDMRKIYRKDALKAYQNQWELAENPTTPPNVRNAIYDSIQNRAGLSPKYDVQVTHEEKNFPDLNVTKEELIKWLDEPQVSRKSDM